MICRALLRICRALLRICRAHLGIDSLFSHVPPTNKCSVCLSWRMYRALLRTHAALLWINWSLWWICLFLLRICRAPLQIYRAFSRIYRARFTCIKKKPGDSWSRQFTDALLLATRSLTFLPITIWYRSVLIHTM